MNDGDLRQALEQAGWQDLALPNLHSAYELSEQRIGAARAQLREDLSDGGPDLDVVAFGSLARREMTTASDLDWLVVVHSVDKEPGTVARALDAADGLRSILGGEGGLIAPPGSSGVFGQMVSAVDLVEVIGLQDDTNHSHTRRILLIEESVSLLNEALHAHLLTSIFRRYLEAHPPAKTGVPRFLLNDLVRYWHTVAIDYQAKSPAHSMYSLRYLKLIVSRKFTFAASLLPLLVLALEEENLSGEEFSDRLFTTYSSPPTVRFIRAGKAIADRDPSLEPIFRDVLTVVEDFNTLLGQQAWREEIAAGAVLSNPKDQPTFAAASELGVRLQSRLQSIFFAEPILGLTKKYLVF